jgi:predicted N-acetyltransferase YhbS
MKIRPAVPADAPDLDAIALEAKAHWGYAQEQIEIWKADLRTSPASLSVRPTFVAESDHELVGFAQLDPSAETWELVSMWVRPAHMGRGIGRALLAAAAATAKAAGQSVIAIDSDPNAEPFYRACGAELVGSVPAPIQGQPARVRPQLRLFIGAAKTRVQP